MIRGSGTGRVRHSLTLGRRDGKIQIAENDAARLLLTIGQAVFEFENASKKSQRSQLEIEVPPDLLHLAQAPSLATAIERLISFVILSETDVSFLPSSDIYQKAISGLNRKVDAVCLFSGGVDSISGTLLAAQAYQNLSAVFCTHLHQGRVISITRRLGHTYLRRQNVDLYEVPAPSMKASGYAQTRGWLYIMSAAAAAVWLGCNRIIVSECGPTMYQPKFGPSDQTTMTTHPFLMSRAQDVLDIVVPGLKILTPFDNFTKAEVMAVCPEPRVFGKTHSCISQRLEIHDGTCYGCVVRRLAAIASGSPDVEYANDPITQASANSGNLLALLDFSVNFLANSRTIPSYQQDMIFGYRRGKLFRRFALDNMAALYRLKTQRRVLSPAVEQIYNDALAVLDGVKPLKNRIQALAYLRTNPPNLSVRARGRR